MNPSIRFLLSGLLMSALFLGCQRENLVEQKEYPRLRETVVLSVDESGIACRALFLSPGESEIVDHGFIWTKGGTPIPKASYDLKEEPKNMEKLSLGKLSTQSSFEAKITYGLARGSSYQIRSYLKTADGYTVYGHPVQFNSEGSLPPRVTAFEPAMAVWGDTITIIGENFSYLPGTVQVTFEGGNASKVVSSTSTSIRCIVPNSVPYNTSKVTVQVVGGTTTSAENFKIDTSLPVITSVSPMTGSRGDTITIRGQNFPGSRPYWNVVFKIGYSEMKAQAIKMTKNEIQAIIPELVFKEYQVLLLRTNGNQSFYSEPASQPFRVAPPGLEALETLPGPNFTHLLIKGNGFTYPKVSINGSSARVLSSTKSQILIDPIDLVFPKPIATLSVEVTSTEQRDVRQFTLAYSAPWIKRSTSSSGPLYLSGRRVVASFQLGESGYVISSLYDYNQPLQVHRFNSVDYTWERLSDIPLSINHNHNFTTFQVNNKAYLLVKLTSQPAGNNTLLWRFDPENGKWQSLRSFDMDYLETYNESLVSCTIGNKGYLFSKERQGTVWEYDAGNDTWRRLRNNLVPYGGWKFTGAFAWKNKLYALVSGNTNTIIYSYETGTDTWQFQTSFNYLFRSTIYVSGLSENKVRLASVGEVLEFDPEQKVVSQLTVNRAQNDNYTTFNGFMIHKRAFIFGDNATFWEASFN